MAIIDFYIRNQKLSKTGPKLVADSINYVNCSFTFKTDDWNGFDKWVVFSKGEEAYRVNLVDDAIPKETGLNLGEGLWNVSLFGESPEETERITTNSVTVEVAGSTIQDGEPLPPIALTEAEQIAAKAQRALDAANEVLTKAENGEFNGKDGEDGKDGVDGEDYILTENDKKEIAGMMPKDPDEIYIGETAPTDPNIKIWVDPNEENSGSEVTAESINAALGYVPANEADIPKKPEDVGAEKSGAVAAHNVAADSHSDIRVALGELKAKIEAFLDIDEPTLDQLSELIAKIQANAGTIEQLTNGKVNVADIVNNLTTNASNKPLSAAQGVALKGLIDGIKIPTVPTNVSAFTNDAGYAKKTELPTVPTKVSAFENDKGYITAEDIPEGGGTNADWSQNDETAADYVKNRTHWAEPNNTIAVPEQTVQIEGGEGMTMDILEPSFVIGDNYEVTYNGTVYNSVSFDVGGMGCLGNPVLADGDDNGQPFFLAIAGGMLLVMDLVGNESATFKVVHNGETVHKIAPKFVDNQFFIINLLADGDGALPVNTTVEEIFSLYRSGKMLIAKFSSAGENLVLHMYFYLTSYMEVPELGTILSFDGLNNRGIQINENGTIKITGVE